MDSVMYEERFERWLKVSIGLARFDPFIPNLVQSLGKMDATLCEMDVSLVEKYKQGGNANECHERCNSDPHPTPEIRSRG